MKKFLFGSILGCIMFASCSKEDTSENDLKESAESTPMYSVAGPSGSDDCRTLDLNLPEACKPVCLDCPKTTVTVSPESISGLDNLVDNGDETDISTYFNSNDWHEVFSELLESKWSGVLDALQTGVCVNIERHDLDAVTVFVFYDNDGNHFYAQPVVIE